MQRTIGIIIVAALVTGGALMAQGRAARSTTPDDPAYSLEARTAIGAHHICSGLWVVGGVYQRTAEEIVAQDIAPFKDFSWDKSFQYRIDNQSHTVTVSSPGTPPRRGEVQQRSGLRDPAARRTESISNRPPAASCRIRRLRPGRPATWARPRRCRPAWTMRL